MPVKVFLVEDHEIVRSGIKAILEKDPQVNVIGEASNGREALDKLSIQQPDVLLMDMNMPVMNGLECTKRVIKDFPDVKVLILSMHDHESYLMDMLDAGAKGYILKNSSKDELLFAIRRIAADGMYIGPEFTMNILARAKTEKASQPAEALKSAAAMDLTAREMDVLKLIAQGLTNFEISNKLFTSVRTIETRRKKLLEKTNTNNTATLIRYAIQQGLIE